MTTWPTQVWEAIDSLAHADLSHYPKHVHDRSAFLGTARAKRVDQHRQLIESLLATNPDVTAEQVAAACNPKPKDHVKYQRDYDWEPVDCADCGGVGRKPVVVDDVERWDLCATCRGQRKRAS